MNIPGLSLSASETQELKNKDSLASEKNSANVPPAQTVYFSPNTLNICCFIYQLIYQSMACINSGESIDFSTAV